MRKFLLFTVFFLFLAGAVWGQATFTWTGAANDGGLWETPGNWDDGSNYPGQISNDDIVTIDIANTSVSISSAITLGSLTVKNNVSFVIDDTFEVTNLVLDTTLNITGSQDTLNIENITVTANGEVSTGTINMNGSTVQVTPLGTVTINSVNDDLGNINASGNLTINVPPGKVVEIGNINSGGNLTIEVNAGSTATVLSATASGNTVYNGNVKINSSSQSNYVWNGSSSNVWTVGANWDVGISPCDGDSAYTITINTSSNNPVYSGAGLVCDTLEIATNASLDMGNNNLNVDTLDNKGDLTIAGNLNASTLTNSGNLFLTGNGQSVTPNTTPIGGTVTYDNASGNDLAGLTDFTNLTIQNGTRAGVGAITVSGTLTIGSTASLDMGANNLNVNTLINSNTLKIAGDLNASTLTNSGNLFLTGNGQSVTPNTTTIGGTVTYDNASGNDLAGLTYFTNLTIINGIRAAGGAVTVSGTLTIQSGASLDMGVYDLTVTTASTNNGTLILTGASGQNVNLGTVSINDTVIYSGNGTSFAGLYNFNNLTIQNGARVASVAIAVSNNLTINTGASLDMDAYNLTINSIFDNKGTFDGGTGTVILSGTAVTIKGDNTFNNLNCTGATVSFEDGKTQTVTNLTASGSTLKAINSSTHWILTLSNPTTSYPASIAWCEATSNLNWTYPPVTDNGNNIKVFINTFVWIGTKDSNWSDVDNWQSGIIPPSPGNATHTITINLSSYNPVFSGATLTCGTLTIDTDASLDMGANNLDVNTLTNNGNLILEGSGSQNVTITTTPSTVGGTVTYKNTGNHFAGLTNFDNITIQNGTRLASGAITVSGTLTVDSSAILNMGTSSLNVTTSFTNVGTLLLQGVSGQNIGVPVLTNAGNVTYNATAPANGINLAGLTSFNDLKIENGARIASGAITVSGILTIDSGASLDMGANNLDVTNTLTNDGTLKIAGNLNASTLTNSGNLFLTGNGQSVTPNTTTIGGTVTYDNASGNDLAGLTYFTNLTIINGARAASGAITVSGTLLIATGASLDMGANNLDVTTTLTNNGNLKLSGDLDVVTLNNAGNLVFEGNGQIVTITTPSTIGGTVIYNNSGNLITGLTSFTNLTIQNGARVASGAITVSTNLTINTGASLNMGAYNLTINSVLDNKGTFDGGTGTVILSGTTVTVKGNNTFNNLDCTGAATVSFENGKTQTITNLIASNTTTTLKAIAPSSRWMLNLITLPTTSFPKSIAQCYATTFLNWSTGTVNDGLNNINVFTDVSTLIYIWNGLKDSNWNDTGNWQANGSPGDGDSDYIITINSSSHNPVFSDTGTGLECDILTIQNGASLDMGDYNLSLKELDNFGTLILAGTITQTVTVSGTITNAGDVTYNATIPADGVSLAGLKSFNNLTIENGNRTDTNAIIVNGNFNLASGTLSAASVAVTGTSSIAGNITTTATQTYTGAVTLGGTVGTKTLTGTTVTLGAITGNGNSLEITGSGVLNGGSGINNLSVSGTSSINADITTTGNQTYTGAATLSVTKLTITSQNGNIEFNNALSSSGEIELIAAGSSPGGNITLGGATSAKHLIMKAANGTVSVKAITISSNTGNEGENAAIYIEADTFVVTTSTANSIKPGETGGQLCLNLKNKWTGTYNVVDGAENVRWHQHLPNILGKILYSFTEDSNGNGKLDRIRVQTNKVLYGGFSGFDVDVSGYHVTGYALVDGDSFYINLEEKSEFDGGNLPVLNIIRNTSLLDASNTPVLDQTDIQYIDTIPPRIAYTLTLPGYPQTYVQMTEPVVSTSGSVSASFDGAPVNASQSPQLSSGYLFASTSYAVNILVNLPIVSSSLTNGYFQMTNIVDKATPPSVTDPSNPPKYPVNWNYSSYATSGTLKQPPNKLLDTIGTSASDTVIRRVTDVLISRPPEKTGDNNYYFAWPVWARFQKPLNAPYGNYGDVFWGQQPADMGIIWQFDGTNSLETRFVETNDGIELQARIDNTLTAITSLELYWTTTEIRAEDRNPKIASDDKKTGGLWLPDITINHQYNYVPLSVGIKNKTASVSSKLSNYSITASELDVDNSAKFEFIFRLSSASDMFIANLDIPRGSGIPSNWYTLLRPFSFNIRNNRRQRGGVTIMNNVINSNNREVVYIRYNMLRPGRVTVQIYTLDGTLVKSIRRNEQRGAGEWTDSWDGTNNGGRAVARGMYFVRVVGPDIDEIRKIMVIK